MINNRLKKWIKRVLKKPRFADGHYYSPIPDSREVILREAVIFSKDVDVKGIELKLDSQRDRLFSFLGFKKEFEDLLESGEARYSSDNGFFNYSDGFHLFGMMRDFKPSRIIEVGSGFSSALMLDTNDMYFNKGIKLSFIEPFPARLNSLLNENDSHSQVITQKVQEIQLDHFEQLKSNDFLFIDSSHVSKVGSDVNFLLFNVLPVLKPGVIIHFHDIIWPFEYPKEWIYEGRYWNEAYLLRAFLMNNDDYEVLLFNNYLAYNHQRWLKEHLPECCVPGGSLYLRKLR